MIENNGRVVWGATYKAFGKATIKTEEVENNLRFPGQYYDQTTGLHHNYFRDYDSATGRYIQADPVGLNGGLNIFGYVRSNPSKYIDFLGETPFNVIIVEVAECIICSEVDKAASNWDDTFDRLKDKAVMDLSKKAQIWDSDCAREHECIPDYIACIQSNPHDDNEPLMDALDEISEWEEESLHNNFKKFCGQITATESFPVPRRPTPKKIKP